MNRFWQMFLAALRAVWLPAVVFLGGALIMRILSGHDYVDKQLREQAVPEDRTPLNMRFLGYDTDAVARHWGVFDERALQSERKFLQLDLGFPLFYGAALAIALWQAWTASGKPFSAAVLVALVAVTMIADWTENLIQLSQLQLFAQHGKEALQPGQIRIASAATIVKLIFFTCAVLLPMILAGRRAIQQTNVLPLRGADPVHNE